MNDWKKPGWQADMRVAYDFNYMMDEYVGKTNGIAKAGLDALADRAKDIHNTLAARRKAGELPFYELPYQDTTRIKELADELASEFDSFVHMGIGGSALGPVALHTALKHPLHNLLSRKDRGERPKMFFIDNVDPDHTRMTLSALDLKESVFNVVTKSGSTAETMSCFMLARGMVKEALGKSALKDRFVAVTDAGKGNLRLIADKEGYRTLDVPNGVGGRFSVFTPVGLLPAAVSGIDIDELLAGAADMDKRTSKAELWENPAYIGAALQYLADTKKRKNISVMMPYSSRLKDVADWYRQLWAESLGKKTDLSGKVIHAGQTPVKALGATDQHSQVQLYIEGPADKTFTFLRVDSFDEELVMPRSFADIEGVSYLGGRSMNELINAEQAATEIALMKAGRPSSKLVLPALNAFTVGQVLYLLEVMTVFAGALYNIDPLDQPGVEEGKQLTYAMMDRPGYENKKVELSDIKKKKTWYVV